MRHYTVQSGNKSAALYTLSCNGGHKGTPGFYLSFFSSNKAFILIGNPKRFINPAESV